MSRRIDLDFVQAPRLNGRAWGWIALAVVAAVLAWRADGHAERMQSIETLQARQEALALRGDPSRANPPARDSDPATQQRIVRANAVIARLALPWDTLFGAFEAADSRALALLALEPNVNDSTVRVSAEARSLPEVLAYVERLAQQPGLSQVHLQSYETVQRDGARVLAFQVLARWGLP